MPKPYAEHFSRLAPAYASWRPRYPEALFDYLANLVTRRGLAWDCAAGSGQATIPLAGRFGHVVATDISAPMLSLVPPHPRVECRVAPADASGLPGGSVDLVAVAQALHWLDPGAFFAEAERVLAPGGVLAVWTYGTQQLDDPTLQQELASFYLQVVGPYWPRERCHVESGYRTLPFPYHELEPPPFVMEEHWDLSRFLGYLRTWSATQRFSEQVGYDPVTRLEPELAAAWGDRSRLRNIRWPLVLRVGCKPS